VFHINHMGTMSHGDPDVVWLIRAMRLIEGSIGHRINRITHIHHIIPEAE